MAIQWKFEKSTDPTTEDDSTALLVDLVETGITIQHCAYAGGFAVGEVGHDPEWYHVDHGTRASLDDAKALALVVLAADPKRWEGGKS